MFHSADIRTEEVLLRHLSCTTPAGGHIPEGELDWGYILNRAEEQGVAGLLWRNLKALGCEGVPPRAMRRLKVSYLWNVMNYELYFRELGPVLRDFCEGDISFVLLRGPVLVRLVYGDPGLRGFTDVDIWTREGDLRKAQDVLRDNGFSPLDGYPLLFHRGGVWVDLHSDLVGTGRVRSRGFGVKLDHDAVWNDARPLMMEGYEVLALSVVDRLLFLCLHALKHSFWRLIWTVDIAETVRKHDIDWDAFVRRARDFGLERPAYYGLLCAKELLGAPVPEEALLPLSVRRGYVERKLSELALSGLGTDGLSEALYLFSIPKVSQKLRFLWEVVFLRPEVRPQVDLRGGPLFYPRRMFKAGALALDIARRLCVHTKSRSFRCKGGVWDDGQEAVHKGRARARSRDSAPSGSARSGTDREGRPKELA